MTRTWCCRAAVAAVAAVAALAVAGCTDDDGAAGSSATSTSTAAEAATTTTVDPKTLRGYPRVCQMASIDNVSAATGVDVVASEQGVLRGVTTCVLLDGDGEKVAAVSAGPAERFTDAQAAADATPADGLGAGAVWSDGTLYVLMGDESLGFKLYPAAGIDPTDAEGVIRTIAVDALARYEPPDDATP